MFKNFEFIDYKIGDQYYTLQNIVPTNNVKRFNIDKLYSIDIYEASDYKSLEVISDELYGTHEYAWTLLVLNDFTNPMGLWFNNDLVEYCQIKYEDGADGIHHFYNMRTGLIVDDLDDMKYREEVSNLPHDIKVVTNLEYELTKVEMKKNLYYVKNRYILDFVNEYRRSLKDVDHT